MALTRFLYMADEVVITFMENLIKQKNRRECYFWIAEYYYSGFRSNTWKLLWQLFYDFYAINYPKLEGFIWNEYKKWKKKRGITPILYITSMLFDRVACPAVFLARHTKKKKYNGNTLPWADNYSQETKPLLLSIHHNDLSGIAYHMTKVNTRDMYDVICSYFQTVHNVTIKRKLASIPYNNKNHILWAVILRTNKSEIALEDSPVSKKDLLWINDINDINIHPLYHTLSKKRSYAISNTIGCFQLQRFDRRCPPIKRLLGFHWQYFASFSPLWKKRFRNHHAKRSAFTMVFENDDYFEQFCDIYDYEPDEQSNETQNKSIIKINKYSPRQWINDVFGVEYHRKRLFPIYL